MSEQATSPGAKEIHTDFPYAPDNWNLQDTQASASRAGISLTQDHWDAISALQQYYARHKDLKINIREIHDALDERFHQQGGIKYLYEMFPGGPVAQGCILAGLEPPAGASDESFGSVQ